MQEKSKTDHVRLAGKDKIMPTSTIKIRFKHIHFEGETPEDLGLLWTCYNNKKQEYLGSISEEKVWGQYVFTTQEGIDFSSSCLRDIAEFLDQLNK